MKKSLILFAFKLIITFLTFIHYSCNSNKINRNFYSHDSIRCFKVSQSFPNVNVKGNLVSYDTMAAWIYYYRNQELYYSSYYYNFDALLYRLLVPDKDTNQIKPRQFLLFDTTLIPEIRYRYFVYSKGNTHGSLFDRNKSEYNKRVVVDSILKSEWTVQSTFDPFIHNTLTLLSAHKDSLTGKLIELYSFRGRKDTGINGTVKLSFSDKLKKGGYSFSKNLDSIKNMKLDRVFIINNSRYLKNYGITLERVEQLFELEEVPVKNREEVLKYFEIDKQESSKIPIHIN